LLGLNGLHGWRKEEKHHCDDEDGEQPEVRHDLLLLAPDDREKRTGMEAAAAD
jgi:hypothetical protein